MKKLTTLMILLLLLFTTLATQGADVHDLDLQSSVELALEQNLDIRIEELNLKKSKLNYEKQKASNLLTQSHYSELQAEYNLAAAQNNYDNVYDNLVKNTVSQYTNLWLKELDLEIKEKNLALEKRKLSEARAKYDIGDIGSVDLLEQENTYNNTKFNLETAQDNYKQSMKEFKTTLGLTDDLFLAEILCPQVWQIEEKKAVQEALSNSRKLKLKNKSLELAQIDLERSQVSDSKLDKNIVSIDLVIAEVEVKNKKEEIINSTQEVYYQFKQAVKKMEIKKEFLTEAKDKYKLIKNQYEAGLVTMTDIIQYEVNKMQAEYQYKSAIANYYLQEQSLRQAMNLKTGVFGNENTE